MIGESVDSALGTLGGKPESDSDAPDVLRAKVAALAGLLRRAHACVCYTGAGISTASGIGDYATEAGIARQGSAEL